MKVVYNKYIREYTTGGLKMKYLKFIYLSFLSMFLIFISNSSKADVMLGSWAVVSNLDNGTISVVNLATGTSYGPFFDGILPDEDIYEIKVTPDGKKALVASFYEQKVYFIDLTDPTNPSLIGSIDTPGLHAENIAISPNGKCAIIGDGNQTNVHLYVINIDSMTASPSPFTLPEVTDVAISPDGSVVIASSWSNDNIRVLSFNQNDCSISDTGNSYSAPNANNAEFSKDGKTLIVAERIGSGVKIFEVNGTTLIDKGEINTDCLNVPSVAIYDNKAYVLCAKTGIAELAIFDITGPGQVSDTGTRIDLSVDIPTGWAYFGVNQIAITPDGKYALVSSEGLNNFISVVDLSTNMEVRTITTDDNSVSVATMPSTTQPSQPSHVDNGRMFGNFTIGNWPNFATVDTNITCNGSITPWFSMSYFDGTAYHSVVAYSSVNVLCYDDPGFTPANPTVLFDSTEAQLTGMMDGYISVRVEIVLKDDGEPGYGRDYVHVKIIDRNTNSVLYETFGTITSGSIYAMPLY